MVDALFMKKDLTETQELPWFLVTISCITYNHAPYIRDSIEGILMQKTTFPVEILIHDDASTDGTADIVREYEKKFPELLLPMYQKKNQLSQQINPFSDILFPRARGKYIALCEGDDYWTDPLKLQKQVDFLETHPEHSGTAHQSMVIYTDEVNKKSHLHDEHNITDIEIDHLLNGRLFHTASFVFRSDIIKKHTLPADITSVDRALFFLVAACGKIYYSNEFMCCYRKHAGGMSSWVTTEMLEKDLKIIPWISQISPKFPKHKYYKFLHLVALRHPRYLSISKVINPSTLYLYHSLYVGPNKFQDIKLFWRITSRHFCLK